MIEEQKEKSGAEQLYHALEAKMIEMAALMNKIKLNTLDISDPKDKSFERIRILWDSAAKVAEAAKSLGQTAGIIKADDSSDRKPFNELIADSRS